MLVHKESCFPDGDDMAVGDRAASQNAQSHCNAALDVDDSPASWQSCPTLWNSWGKAFRVPPGLLLTAWSAAEPLHHQSSHKSDSSLLVVEVHDILWNVFSGSKRRPATGDAAQRAGKENTRSSYLCMHCLRISQHILSRKTLDMYSICVKAIGPTQPWRSHAFL